MRLLGGLGGTRSSGICHRSSGLTAALRWLAVHVGSPVEPQHQKFERYAMCAEKGLVPYMPVRPSTHLGRTGPDQTGCVFFKLVVH